MSFRAHFFFARAKGTVILRGAGHAPGKILQNYTQICAFLVLS